MRERRNAYRTLVWSPENKTPLAILAGRDLADNIKINLKETKSGTLKLIHLTQHKRQWHFFEYRRKFWAP